MSCPVPASNFSGRANRIFRAHQELKARECWSTVPEYVFQHKGRIIYHCKEENWSTELLSKFSPLTSQMESPDSKVTEIKLSPLHHLPCPRVHLLNLELLCAPSVLSTRGNWDSQVLHKIIKLTQGLTLLCPRKEPPWIFFLYAPTVNHHISYQRQGINLKFFFHSFSKPFVQLLHSYSVVELFGVCRPWLN